MATQMSDSEQREWDLFCARWARERKSPPSSAVAFLAGYEAGKRSEKPHDD